MTPLRSLFLTSFLLSMLIVPPLVASGFIIFPVRNSDDVLGTSSTQNYPMAEEGVFELKIWLSPGEVAEIKDIKLVENKSDVVKEYAVEVLDSGANLEKDLFFGSGESTIELLPGYKSRVNGLFRDLRSEGGSLEHQMKFVLYTPIP